MLAKLIKSHREKMSLTQEGLALAAKTTQATISRIEAGEQVPSTTTLFKIAEALRLEPSYLLDAAIKDSKNRGDFDEW
ncbi:MAG: helix-turn-helix transcriptional regulator [Chloroflexi bacterium]|nr:helix-turn-helix transcriptional regulator [Chloroflexota bacterium]